MKLLLGLLAALIAAVAVGQLVASHPGIVAIEFEGRALRMSLALFCVLTLAATLLTLWAVRTLYRVLTFRSRLRRWRAERARRRAQHALEDGLLALAAGDYARAERRLRAGAAVAATPVHYLAAAQAAHALDAPSRRDAYLALAEDGAASLPVGLRRVEMLLDQGEFGAAGQALTPLVERHGKSPQVLRLRQRLLAAEGRWDELAALLPALRKHKVHAESRLLEMEAELAARRLAQPVLKREEADGIWQALSKPARGEAAAVAAYARALLRAGATGEAETLLRKSLDRRWEPRLVALYGELDGDAPAAQLGRAEAWLADRAEDAQLLLTLGRLAHRAGLWGKARGYLEAALGRHPTALGHRLLAEVYDRLDEPALAQRQRALGLELATGGAGALLPAP